jgi:K+-transporting ATPase ATPase C chain
MSIFREVITATRATLVLWILTALIYPFLMIFIGQVFFPDRANGSLITNEQDRVIGSALIGQPFSNDRYFWSRPSTTEYSTGEDAAPTGVSGASNLAPTNSELIERVKTTVAQLQQQEIEPTADLVYTSGSSLDPHITLEAARAQIARVARARNLDTNQVEILISRAVDGRFLGIFGEPGVNVLRLNLALDTLENGQ